MEPIIFTPSRSWIENLQIGDMAIDCFGKQRKVVGIFAKGNDLKGKAFVCYYTEFNHNSKISHSAKEGEVVSTIPVINKYHTTWDIPKELIIESDVLEEK